jgi:hypothetical protein
MINEKKDGKQLFVSVRKMGREKASTIATFFNMKKVIEAFIIQRALRRGLG